MDKNGCSQQRITVNILGYTRSFMGSRDHFDANSVIQLAHKFNLHIHKFIYSSSANVRQLKKAHPNRRNRSSPCLGLLAAQLVHGLQNLFHTFVVQNDGLLLAELVSGDHLRLDVSALANQDRQLRVVLLDRLVEFGYEVSE